MGKFDNYLFRASQLGRLMTNDRSGKSMGETAKKYLLEVYIKEVYGRDKEIINKYVTKGLQVEDDSMTLYCRNIKKFYKKNTEYMKNDFICGTPDIIDDDSIIDLKSSWDLHTFYDVMTNSINKNYVLQLNAYMELTGKKKAKLVYCLVDTPQPLIQDEIKKLQWKMGVSDPEANEVFKQAADYLQTALTFSDIELKKRFIEFTINYDQELINSVYERVTEARKFLNKLS